MTLSATARQTLQALVFIAQDDNPDFFSSLVQEAREEFAGEETTDEVATELRKFVLSIN